MTDLERAGHVVKSLPEGGLFTGMTWRTAAHPFSLGPRLAAEIDSLGRIFYQFYKAVNQLYRRSVEGGAPAWFAGLLDQGKPPELVALQRESAFRNELPRVLRPDILLTEDGFIVSELDSIPGGIGLTQWLNQTYAELGDDVIGGPKGMHDGFASIFGEAKRVHLVISDEASSYRPEMAWLAGRLGAERFKVQEGSFESPDRGDAIYRFFELFDLAQVSGSTSLFRLALEKQISLTPPPRPIFEEKMLFALFWNRHLRDLWRQELGDTFYRRLQQIFPRSWILDPTPLPPNAGYPGLELTDWAQLKALSQRERNFILKISGFSPQAWGSRGVYLGSDLSTVDWSKAVDRALNAWPDSPYLLQQFHKPRRFESSYIDIKTTTVVPMPARVRLCPYYFVAGNSEIARPKLGGILATLNPVDKKIIHGMTDAILVPCTA